MKTSAAPEVENLRAQVRELRASVADLEVRLAELEPELDENPWGIWPYCWIVAGWNFAAHRFHSFHKNVSKRGLAWRNRRMQRAVEGQEFVGLRLT
ncbi:MAG TPA: hypothetical protein VF627_14210 [Abditibacterium sp.]|jgi:hypothetical protein